jgi:hypothetical protein
MSWPVVESEMALLLGQLLGINSEAALAVFETLRRSTAQRDAISAAAVIVLDSKDLELLTAMLDVHKSIEAERNSLAHGHFGIFDKKPDILLWITARDYILLKAKLHLAHVVATTALMDDFASRLSFFRLDDLRKIFESIEYCGHMWPQAINWLQSRMPLRAELYRQLCDQPRIAQALVTLRQKNSPSTQPRSPPPTDCGTS